MSKPEAELDGAPLHQVPFFRPEITDAELAEVSATLRSGWLTTGPRVRRFEQQFSEAVAGKHAVAVNSCTAALHLAVDALGLRAGQAVLVPTMTFAATAEVVRYQGATPILVDCDPKTCNLDLADAERKLALANSRQRGADGAQVVGIMPVHVGGLMMNMDALSQFVTAHGLWTVEDAAHAFPAAWRPQPDADWRQCGQNTASVTCFSFYANKTITTGEGGMAVTDDAALADRIRLMSLHGLSRDAWDRYSGGSTWDYKIVAPGYKYNLTDVAAALGIHQLARAEQMRQQREAVAGRYLAAFRDADEIELPVTDTDVIHAWHLFPIRLRLDRLSIDRNRMIDVLWKQGVRCSVHWRPLHLHPYYQETYGLTSDDCPIASALFDRLISLPLFSSMTPRDVDYVVDIVTRAVRQARR
jgi:perosamine synthetase